MAGDADEQEAQDGGQNKLVDEEQRKESRLTLEQWLNKSMRIKMTDGRTLVGVFLCTDCDCNIIMGSCEEYLKPPDCLPKEDPRILGLAMIPGKHVISIEIDETASQEEGNVGQLVQQY
ncbi:N-alpha-acetyltransferase 38, NatC auxiliary subunit [Aplysia californica]|uniref:N-alpha-acetyltransferase 38, NatC auxiliary subunit n=1 Tax=Aplysia californica TaxID=6500 RepID=A0ABM1A4E2_APLCA|nr:N-alpha-acetyltransferase 38, NatC auxiliary subunit [Aplysia californica]